MPELPEIYNISEQLKKEIVGLKIIDTNIIQEKTINMDVDEFKKNIINQEVISVTSKGKWIFIHFKSKDSLHINLGMGGDLLYSTTIPKKKHQAVIMLNNNHLLSFRFWWFGYIHFVDSSEEHDMTKKLGVDLIRDNISKKEFVSLFSKRKGSLKSFLLNQKKIAGIGNYYIHDILYKAKINPLKKIPELSTRKLGMLYESIIEEFNESILLNGADYELDIYNIKGSFSAGSVAYKEGKNCQCGTLIKKIKTGSTSSYYCPKCQK